MTKHMEIAVTKFVQYAKAIPGFSTLPLEDQANLIKSRSRRIKYTKKCSKLSNTFLFLFSNNMLGFRAEIHKKLGGITTREGPDQTASFEAV